MVTRSRLADDAALASVEDESTVWGPALDNSERLEIAASVKLVEQAEWVRDEAVFRARRRGLPWFAIGNALGVSAEAARKKYKDRC